MSLCAKEEWHTFCLPFAIFLSHCIWPVSWHTQIVFQAISESAKSRIGTLCPSSSSGHPSGLRDPCAIVLAGCLLADTSNNPEIWPPSNLITAPATIDPAPGGFPSGDTSLSRSLLTYSLSFSPHWLPFSLAITLFVSHSLSSLSLCLLPFFQREVTLSAHLFSFLLIFMALATIGCLWPPKQTCWLM